jgi:hypothetical protein
VWRIALVALALALAAAAPAAAKPRILATGDSMMMLTDRQLRSALAGGRATVMSDIRVATGLTKPQLFDWQSYAVRQVRRRRPDVVVMAMGANEAFPIGRARCCGSRWRVRYAVRMERLARTWRRAGVDRVYWLTLPAPVESFLTPIIAGVNAAVVRARGVSVIDTRPILTPDGVFVAEAETSPGVVEKIRSDDGVHLWHAGARLVAAAIVARLEADGVLAPPATK